MEELNIEQELPKVAFTQYCAGNMLHDSLREVLKTRLMDTSKACTNPEYKRSIAVAAEFIEMNQSMARDFANDVLFDLFVELYKNKLTNPKTKEIITGQQTAPGPANKKQKRTDKA